MQAWYHELDKAELHLHLEGSVSPETLVELDPGLSLDEIEGRYRYPDFPAFIESYKWVIGHLNRPEDYALIARRLFQQLASQRVQYAEVTLSAGVILRRGQELGPIWDALRDQGRQAPLQVRWILDAVRQWGAEEAMQVARFAAARAAEGVAAFGIGGNEALGPVEWFDDVFAFARASGLHLTVHAGEAAGPESVWGALRLGAERIGHGIRAADDPSLLAWLRDHDIPLELCVSSNLATGVVPSLAEHPLRRIYEAGVPLVLGTDDPAMFHATLESQYDLAAGAFGFSEQELRAVIANGFRYAFSR